MMLAISLAIYFPHFYQFPPICINLIDLWSEHGGCDQTNVDKYFKTDHQLEMGMMISLAMYFSFQSISPDMSQSDQFEADCAPTLRLRCNV